MEEIEREEAALREDMYSADRKMAEYYNVCMSFVFCLTMHVIIGKESFDL